VKRPYAPPMLFKLDLCNDCAAKLETILRSRGEDAMAESLGDVLCEGCLARVPGYEPDRKLVGKMKRTPPAPAGEG
jgi:hypothetical protein